MKHCCLAALLLLASTGYAATIIETETPRKLTPTGTLGTCGYKTTTAEQPYFQKLDPSETVTGSFLAPYSILGKKDKYVSWFAILRGIAGDRSAPEQYSLLLEQKYFDGMTDCHIMLISKSGAGDFQAIVATDKAKLVPLLALVRVYGRVVEETGGLPRIQADYIRVWPWLTFTLTDLGPEDHSNPKWRKLCELCKSGRVYKPYPDENYYRHVLGDPKDFATTNSPSSKSNTQ